MASGTPNKPGSFLALSAGVIASHLERGQTPPRDRAVFRILGTKALLDKKYRFAMTDGVDKYNQGMIILRDGDKLPEKGDVVDLGIKSRGANKNKMVIQDDRNILVVHNFTFVNNTANALAYGNATSDPTTPSTSSGGVGTPAKPCKRPAPPEDSSTPVSAASTSNGNAAGMGAGTAKRALFGSQQRQDEDRRQRDDSQPPSSATHTIKDLNPYQNKYTILAKVTEKGQLAERHSQSWSGHVFNVTFQDESGDIRASAFDEHAKKFNSLLKEGNFYYVSYATIKPIRDKKWNTTTHTYELNLNQNTVVNECHKKANLPQIACNFTPLKDIESKSAKESVNVLGYCQRISDLAQGVNRSGKSYKKRDIFLVDGVIDENVKVTLWDEKAEEFNGDKKVVAFKGGKINEWNGKKSISGGNYEYDPDLDEARALLSRIEANSVNNSSLSSNNSSLSTSSDQSTLGMIKLELQNSPIADSGRYITVDANFTEIKRDNMAYMACPSEGCQKKVTERSGGGGSYDCKSCGRVDGYKYRFIIKGSIADSTGYQWVTAFEDAGAMIFGMSANDLMEIREKKERDFHDRVDKVLFGKFRFRLRYKMESYNDQRRANVTVDKAEKIDQSTSEYLYDVEKQVEELKRCLNL